MSRTIFTAAGVMTCLLVAACGGERREPPRTGTDAAPERAITLPPAIVPAPLRLAPPAFARGERRPASKAGVIALEGFPERFTLLLFRTPAAFSLPFSTYVPSDMLVQATPGAVSFVANFASHRNDGVALRIRPLPAGTGVAAARLAAARLASGARGRAARQRRFDWSLAEYPLARRGGEGVVALARHGDRYLLVTLEYGAEYAEGFLPRASRILEELRWSDDSSPLGTHS